LGSVTTITSKELVVYHEATKIASTTSTACNLSTKKSNLSKHGCNANLLPIASFQHLKFIQGYFAQQW
jgi:hypothetical protein